MEKKYRLRVNCFLEKKKYAETGFEPASLYHVQIAAILTVRPERLVSVSYILPINVLHCPFQWDYFFRIFKDQDLFK